MDRHKDLLDAGYRRAPAVKRVAPAHQLGSVTPFPDCAEFDWTYRDEIAKAQEKYKDSASTNSSLNAWKLTLNKGAV